MFKALFIQKQFQDYNRTACESWQSGIYGAHKAVNYPIHWDGYANLPLFTCSYMLTGAYTLLLVS